MRNVAAQQRTLLSNRAAAHEKLGRLDLALDDCAQILRTVRDEGGGGVEVDACMSMDACVHVH